MRFAQQAPVRQRIQLDITALLQFMVEFESLPDTAAGAILASPIWLTMLSFPVSVLTFDILSGEYLDCVAHLRAAFSANAERDVDLRVTGTVNGKQKSVELTFRASDQYLIAVGGRQLHEKETSYTRMPEIVAFTNSHIDSALTLQSERTYGDQAQSLRAMIFITSEAARFHQFSENVDKMIAARGTGFPAINYREALFFMKNYDQIRRLGAQVAPAIFKPLTAANMHNFLYHEALQRGVRDVQIAPEHTRERLDLTSVYDIRHR